VSAAARAWLRARAPAAPPRLAERLERALAGDAAPAGAATPAATGDGAGVPEVAAALAAAALERLEVAVAHCDERAAAYDLLAADALLTYACEAAAEAGPEALLALTAALAPVRFEALLPGDAE
jgi:hypothetical protein